MGLWVEGVVNALNKAHAVQLQGGSASNMNQYTPVQLCNKVGALNTMRTIPPKY